MKQEDYLETIYELSLKNENVRISDVAKALDLSKPSVTQMIQRLDKDGCVIYKPYSTLKLTTKGKTIGKKIASRHEVLAEFFDLLGIPENIQEKDIHGIEHHLSSITKEKIKELTIYLKKNKYKN
ncbi:MAG: transcriptional regulator MntR [bacterium]|nr:transcriptional regulator MntR [bacterium]